MERIILSDHHTKDLRFQSLCVPQTKRPYILQNRIGSQLVLGCHGIDPLKHVRQFSRYKWQTGKVALSL